jgi:hypothetical protein
MNPMMLHLCIVFLVSLLIAGLANARNVHQKWVVGKSGENWQKNAQFDKTHIRSRNVELLNGYNPANGFWVSSGGQSGKLDAEDRKVSARFTAQDKKTVTEIRIWPKYLTGTSPQFRMGLQEDRRGLPCGEWLGSGVFRAVLTERDEIKVRGHSWASAEWAGVKLDKPVDIQVGRIYHLVVQWEAGKIDSGNNVRIAGVGIYEPDGTILSNSIVPRNDVGDTNINGSDPAIMALSFDGEKWSENSRRVPIFLLVYSDGSSGGQPCAHWRTDLWGERYIGELVRIVGADKEVTRIAVPLRKSRNPRDDLQYDIRDSGNTILRQGVLARKEEIRKDRFVWFSANIGKSLVLKKGCIYRIVIKTPKTTRDSGMISTDAAGYACEPRERVFPAYSSATYDGINSMCTFSSDGGKTWREHPSRDISFKLKLKETQSGRITSVCKDAEQVAGKGARWMSIHFDGCLPKDTTVSVLVSSSKNLVRWSDFVAIKEVAESGESYPLPAANQKRYLRWRLLLQTRDVKISPTIDQVVAKAAGR